jgi:predicted nucleotide-binding protein (sugar kinase/HSP70/actin superfamily)
MEQTQIIGVHFNDEKLEHVSRERLKDMWNKAEALLSTPDMILPCAGATISALQVASLSSFKAGNTEPPHLVTTQKRNSGAEVKCDCPVYTSSPNICQHAIAATEDMNIFSEYLHWVQKTKNVQTCLS